MVMLSSRPPGATRCAALARRAVTETQLRVEADHTDNAVDEAWWNCVILITSRLFDAIRIGELTLLSRLPLSTPLSVRDSNDCSCFKLQNNSKNHKYLSHRGERYAIVATEREGYVTAVPLGRTASP